MKILRRTAVIVLTLLLSTCGLTAVAAHAFEDAVESTASLTAVVQVDAGGDRASVHVANLLDDGTGVPRQPGDRYETRIVVHNDSDIAWSVSGYRFDGILAGYGLQEPGDLLSNEDAWEHLFENALYIALSGGEPLSAARLLDGTATLPLMDDRIAANSVTSIGPLIITFDGENLDNGFQGAQVVLNMEILLVVPDSGTWPTKATVITTQNEPAAYGASPPAVIRGVGESPEQIDGEATLSASGGSAENPVTIFEDTPPLADLKSDSWALLNLISMLLGIVLAILYAAWGISRKAFPHMVADKKQNPGRDRLAVRAVVAAALATAQLAAFLLTEDIRRPMIFADVWTPLMLLLMMMELMILVLVRRHREDEENTPSI